MFYKILNSNMFHNGLQYKLGLNRDVIPFNPNGTCETGGIYFTDKENIYKFFCYGNQIAEITIPEDAKVYRDPEQDKWKADMIYITKIYPISELKEWNDEDFCRKAIKEDPYSVQYIKNQTEEICLNVVKRDGYSLQFVRNQTEDICLKAVQENGYALRFVKEQTLEICLEAVKRNGCAVFFVNEQILSPEICLEAVKQDPYALQYIKKQNLEICIKAVKRSKNVIRFVNSEFVEQVEKVRNKK